MGEYGSHSDEVAPRCLKIGHVRAERTPRSRPAPRWGIRRRNCRIRRPRTTSVVRRWCSAPPARRPHPPSRWRQRRTPSVPPNRLRWNQIRLRARPPRESARPRPARARACAEGCRAVPAETPPPTARPAARRGQWSRWRRSAPAQFKRDGSALMPRAVPAAPAEAGWAAVAVPGLPAPAQPERWGRCPEQGLRVPRAAHPDRRARWGRLPGR